MHSEGIMAGELKHGPLALVDGTMPVLMIVLRDPVYLKCMNALLQVKARDCHPILICEENDKETMSHSGRSLEVPRTVDCLQVHNRCSYQLSSLKLNILFNNAVYFLGCAHSNSHAIACISHSSAP